MTSFNRGLFSAGTKMQSIKTTQKAAEKYDKKFYNEGGNFLGYHYPEEGKNIFRIAPAHDPQDSPYMPIRYSQMEVEVDEYDKEGNKTGKKVWQRRKCFIATQHGPWDKNGNTLIKKDPIEVYIEYVQNKASELYASDVDKQKYIAPLRGYWENDKFQWGISPETKTICLAWNENWELKQLELNKKWYQEMEKMSFDANSDGVMAVDIFSHVDNGIPLIIEKVIKREKGKKNKTEYKVYKDEPNMMKRESWDDFFDRNKVDDVHLKELLEKKSLKELYHENYSLNEFIKVVKGLRNFDEKWEFNLFSNADFLADLEEIEKSVKDLLPEEAEKEEENTEEKEETSEPKEEKAINPEPIKMSVPKKRAFIKQYITDNYEQNFDVKLLTKTEVETWFDLAYAGEDLPMDEYKTPEEDLPNDLPWEVDDDTLAEELKKLKESGK